MKKSTKAILVSTFIFPGAGHLLLKRFTPATLLAFSALTSLYFLTEYSLEKALSIAGKIQNSSSPLDIAQLQLLISDQLAASRPWYLDVASATLVIVWLAGIIGAYRYGRLIESEQ